MTRKVTIVFFDAGGGHRSAAEALKSVLESQARPWEVQLLNLQQELDKLDLLRKIIGLRIQDAYNLILRKGWTRLTPQLLPVLQSIVRMYHRPTVRMLCGYWKDNPADLVLSVIPHFNRALVESIRLSSPGTTFVTLLTDLADYPPHFWMERESEYLICGTQKAEQQAFELGHDENHVFLASGMILRPNFYRKNQVDKATERTKLALDATLPTGIVLFGGHGSSVMLDIVRNLNSGRSKLQLILVCGKNTNLKSRLQGLKTRFPIFAEGFTPQIDYYMALSDFFIGKPGPGSISEALQFHLPVIVECNASTLPQERYNAQWVTESGLGIVLKDFGQINDAVSELLEPARFAELRKQALGYKNRALFEIPEFLEQIMERRAAGAKGAGSPAKPGPLLARAAWASLVRLQSSHT